MSIIDELIFDRTSTNLVEGDPKGKYDYEDYNRVGQAINYVANELDLSITAKTNWVNTDIPRNNQITTYRLNVKKLLDFLEMDNQIPTTNNNILTILGANQIEKAIYDTHNLAQRIMRWSDVDELNESWETLDSKNKKWNSYFLKY